MSNSTSPSSDAPSAELQSLAPSAKLVAKTLEYEGELTQGQLADETRLPPRTVRHALRDLEDAGLVDRRISFADARKRIYSLEPNDLDRTVSVQTS